MTALFSALAYSKNEYQDQVLVIDQDFVNVVWMGWLTAEMIIQYLKNVLDAGRVINVNVGDTIVPAQEAQL